MENCPEFLSCATKNHGLWGGQKATKSSPLDQSIEWHTRQGNADCALDRREKSFSALSESPVRGACPQEQLTLLVIGVLAYREIFFKPPPSSIGSWTKMVPLS